MSSPPLLSILTPAFNEEDYLAAMVASLQRQSDGRWELLLVDDGSTDGTATEMERLASLDGRIRVISTGRKWGKVAAFNQAFAASRGTHICHIGADDLVPPGSVATRLAATPAQDESVSFGKFVTMDSDGRPTSGPLPRGAVGSRSSAGMTLSRPLAERLFPIPEDLPAEDVWLGSGASALVAEPVHVAEVIYQYRIHSGNSNPRHKPFAEMNEKMFSRARAARALLDQDRFSLTPAARAELETRWEVAQLRHDGDIRGILLHPRLSWVEKLANLSMAHPLLWRVRQSFPQLLTGWRGR